MPFGMSSGSSLVSSAYVEMRLPRAPAAVTSCLLEPLPVVFVVSSLVIFLVLLSLSLSLFILESLHDSESEAAKKTPSESILSLIASVFVVFCFLSLVSPSTVLSPCGRFLSAVLQLAYQCYYSEYVYESIGLYKIV